MNATEARNISLGNSLKDVYGKINGAAKHGAGFILELQKMDIK